MDKAKIEVLLSTKQKAITMCRDDRSMRRRRLIHHLREWLLSDVDIAITRNFGDINYYWD